jgi:hypothetical protein
MTEPSAALDSPAPTRVPLTLALLLGVYVLICCVSLIYVTQYFSGYQLFRFDAARVYPAVVNAAPLALCAILFALSRFSFGYFLGFYLYTMALGYLWIAKFSLYDYDHTVASISAMVSIVAFLAPALSLTAPIRQRLVLSARSLDRLLLLILVFAAGIIAIGALYNFRMASVADIYLLRAQIDFPIPLRYAIGTASSTLLPFAFACFFIRGQRWRAAAALLLLLLLYPVTLTKIALFAPIWLLFLALLAALLEARIAVVMSLLLPALVGVLLVPIEKYGLISNIHFVDYFGIINFRLFAVPAAALDMYNDFFSRHELTYFCQIIFVKPFVSCPYSEYLSIVMSKNYALGNVNASLFATEGIASLGPKWAPLSVFVCGFVIALGNGLSAGLPPKLILLSAGILTQIFLNVPLTTSLLSNGGALLFLLWYVTPREIFERSAR